jgi:hypothetical protein
MKGFVLGIVFGSFVAAGLTWAYSHTAADQRHIEEMTQLQIMQMQQQADSQATETSETGDRLIARVR